MDESNPGATPPLGNVPVMQSEIPPEMFLRAINFDTAKSRNVPAANGGVGGLHENGQRQEAEEEEDLEEVSMNKSQMESTMDLLEQRQAMEQARLLQRFKELRQWQMQQQEILMKQQHMQLEALRQEQMSAQGLIVKQRESHWGGQVKLADTSTRTPPRAVKSYPHRGQGHTKVKGYSQSSNSSQQKQGTLPAPVMYVPLNEDNDEIKTNPDLFSDTNSQAGSHATTDDGFVALPETASEVGIRTKLTFMEEDELDEGIGTQSLQSQGHQLQGHPPSLQSQGYRGVSQNYEEQLANPLFTQKFEYLNGGLHPSIDSQGQGRSGVFTENFQDHAQNKKSDDPGFQGRKITQNSHQPQDINMYNDHGYQGNRMTKNPQQSHDNGMFNEPGNQGNRIPQNPQQSPDWKNISDSDLEEQRLSEEEEEEDQFEDEEDETVHHVEEDLNLDERPVLGTTKTFEELLEEQLRAEESKMRLQETEEQPKAEGSPKRCFLKKGQGIARFGLSDKPASLPSKTNVKSTLPEGARASSVKQNQKIGVKKKEEQKQPQKPIERKQAPQKLSLKKNSPKKQQGQKNSPRDPAAPKPSHPVKGKNPKATENARTAQPSADKSNKSETMKLKSSVGGEERRTMHGGTSPGKQRMSSEAHQDITGLLNKPGNNRILKSPTPESIPDDESFIGRLKQREQNEELEKEDLEEFELLENFADNMSFCSNSSLVTKVLERDRNQKSALTRPLEQIGSVRLMGENRMDSYSKQQPSEQSRSQQQPQQPLQSPRTTVAEQLEATLKRESQPSQQLQSNPMSAYNSDANILRQLSQIKSQSSQQEKHSQRHNKEQGQSVKGRLSDVHEDKEGEERETEEEDNEESESESSETDSDGDLISDSSSESEQSTTLTSPSKVMTRKIATSRDRNSLNNTVNNKGVVNEATALDTVNSLLQKLQADKYATTQSSTDFSLPQKSPIVISKEGGSFTNSKEQLAKYQERFTNDDQFQLHGKFSSQDNVFNIGKKSRSAETDGNISDESLSSYTDLKISSSHSRASSEEKENNMEDEESNKSSDDQDEDDKFDDEDEWSDLTPKGKSPGKFSHSKAGENEDGPPTSKLMSKLFPNLKAQQTKQQIQNQQKLESAASTSTSDGVQSKVMRDKLNQLEVEIEKFKNENLNLERLRREREEGLLKLKKEIAAFEKEKSDELRRIQEYKNEEMKKLKHEKKVFEKYQKTAREMPNKKEREEIEMLKSQLSDLQEELRRKEGRWTSNNARLRSKLELLEQENTELKEEIKLMEMKRLEWLQKEQNAKKAAQRSNVGGAAYTQQITKQFNSNSADFQTTDSDEETDPVRDEPSRSSLQDTVNSNTMSLRPSQYENLVSVRAPPATNTKTTQQKPPPTSHNNPPKPAASAFRGSKPIQGKIGVGKQPQSGGGGSGRSTKSSKSAPPSALSVSTHLLQEDLPRGKPAVAAHQDSSMYSETETSMAEMPRKTNQKFGINKSVINKGDKGYDEMTHSDGKVERIYSTGAREILFTNGTRKEISADGQYISVSFFNGDIKQIMPDQRVIYYYSETQATHTNYPDGLEVLQFPNNQVEKHYPDGTKEITFPDQIIKYLFPGGSEESVFPDGTVIKVDRNGDKTIEFPNGQREIHNQEFKRREYPDGTVKTVYPDGKQETRYSNGRIRVKDKDGNIIVDKRC